MSASVARFAACCSLATGLLACTTPSAVPPRAPAPPVMAAASAESPRPAVPLGLLEPSSEEPATDPAPSSQPAAMAALDPGEAVVPERRVAGGLLVESPPRPAKDGPSRMRTHVEGALAVGSRRVWVGPPVPAFVALQIGTEELFLLDAVEEGHLAFYRDPYGASSCTLSDPKNCGYTARLYDGRGEVRWTLPFSSVLSAPAHLEIQDLRYDRGVLYFNEACQSYSRDAGGKCSSLVAVVPGEPRVLWRTPPRTSNSVMLLLDRFIVSGYGFTAEPDFLFLVRRGDGAVVSKVPLPTAHEQLAIDADGVLTVELYSGAPKRFRLQGLDGDRPFLAPTR